MRSKKLWATAVALVLAVAITGCNWFEGKDYYLTGGNGVYVNIREPATKLINTALVPGCHYNGHCVAQWLHNNIQPNGIAGRYWKTATSYEGDLWQHAIVPSLNSHGRCPTFHIDLTNDINWETHGCHW